MRRFEYYAPRSLQEALNVFVEKGEGGKCLAGGTDLLVQMKEGHRHVPYLVSLRHIPELSGIDFSERDGLRIGAMTVMADIAGDVLIQTRFSALADGAGIVGSYQTRNMATLGGNIANAAPSAETAPPLIVLGAQVRIVGAGASRTRGQALTRTIPDGMEERTIPIEDFFVGPGQTVLGPGDILVDFHVPAPPPRSGSYYERHTPRKEMDIAVVGTAAFVTLNADDTFKEVRICLGAVAPTPIRAHEAERFLIGKSSTDEAALEEAGRLAREASRPISDVRGSIAFRRELVRVMTIRSVRLAAARARGEQVIKEPGR